MGKASQVNVGEVCYLSNSGQSRALEEKGPLITQNSNSVLLLCITQAVTCKGCGQVQ